MIAIIVFYNKSFGAQSLLSFSQELKHCSTIIYDGSDWIQFDFDRRGFTFRCINHVVSGTQLLRVLRTVKETTAIITLDVQEKVRIIWKPWLVRSCNEVCRYAAGVDIGFTFNPRHFYGKLLKYDGRRNYQILAHWRREDGVFRQRQSSDRITE